MMVLRAEVLAVEESVESNVLMAVFADDPDAPEHSLELQVALEHDDQDRELGWNTYSVTVDGGATVYGGVRACRFAGDRLELDFSTAAADELGIDESLVVELRGDHDVPGLRAALSRIFDPDLPQAPLLRL